VQGNQVSEILWCDKGNHPFSANDSDRTVWTESISQRDMQAGKRPERVDTCGPCNSSQAPDVVRVLMAPKNPSPTNAEIARAKGMDEDYVKWLEKQNGIGQE